jgi:hypothetical protein
MSPLFGGKAADNRIETSKFLWRCPLPFSFAANAAPGVSSAEEPYGDEKCCDDATWMWHRSELLMSVIWTIIVGFVAGVVAKFIMPGDNEPPGFIFTTILGIVGAFVAPISGSR